MPDPPLSGIRSLYLCYFGVREPLVQTQVIPYLRQLAQAGAEMTLLTFEPVTPAEWAEDCESELAARLAAVGVRWVWRRYHKSPPVLSTLWDIWIGRSAAAHFLRERGPAVLHARGHWAAAMASGLSRRFSSPLLFDIRGFAPEEYVDAGLWRPRGLRYRAAKCLEAHLMKEAGAFVVLTERAHRILFPGCKSEDAQGRPLQVIPCCVDLTRFQEYWQVSREALRRELGMAGKKVYVYLGALGGWYLADEMAQLFAEVTRGDADAFVLVITQSSPELMAQPLLRHGVPAECFRILRASPTEVPRLLRASDVAVSFIKPSYSKQSSSPTKLAEYLAAGLPVLANAGVGDVDDLLRRERIGVLVSRFDETAYREAAEQMNALRSDPDVSERCRRAAIRHFDLNSVGGAAYLQLYRALAARHPHLGRTA